MVEKVELKMRDIKLLSYTNVASGVVEFDDEDLEFFENDTWKLYVYRVGEKLKNLYKNKIDGKECLINFHQTDKEELMSCSRKSFLGKDVVSPLFYIKYDKNTHMEFCDKGDDKIPEKVFFMILCR